MDLNLVRIIVTKVVEGEPLSHHDAMRYLELLSISPNLSTPSQEDVTKFLVQYKNVTDQQSNRIVQALQGISNANAS